MKITKPTYTMYLSEDELIAALEHYTLYKYNQYIKIKRLKHREKIWTEGEGGMPEMDYTTPDGVEFTCEGEQP